MRPARRSATQRYRSAFLAQDHIAELEGLLGRAWPAAVIVDFGGWEVRRTVGGQPLQNAVWPRVHRDGQPLDERIASVERFFASAGLAPRFLLGPTTRPRGLTDRLRARGYRDRSGLQVRTLRFETFASRADGPPAVVHATAEPDDGWLEAWAQISGQPPAATTTAARLLSRVQLASRYLVLRADGQVVAAARATIHGGWLGVDHLAALPAWQHPGAGQALVGDVAKWGADSDAEWVHLLVDGGRGGAAAMVSDLGGRAAVSYRLWVGS